MAILANLARMSTATTGTGTITLGSAVSGFLSFASAGVTDGQTITYAIRDGASSEIGRGVYTASGTTLTRSVLKSTNSGAAISLSGTAQVFITPSAEDFLEFTNAALPCEGRLTLTSGTAVTTADVTGATTIYFTPYKGNRIALYDGSKWIYRSFTEKSLALGTISDATNYDVFLYDNSGTVAIDTLVAWTNATTRATAITLQDGVYVKDGATTRRYVGTIRTTATTTTEDSLAKRFVWNMHHRVPRPMRVWDTTDTWTYSTATLRQANGSTANQLAFVRGVNEDAASASVSANVVNSTSSVRYVRVAVGLDSTTAPASDSNVSSGACTDTVTPALLCNYTGLPGLGYHYLAWLEKGHGADRQTWRGDAGQTDLNLGINGTVMA